MFVAPLSEVTSLDTPGLSELFPCIAMIRFPSRSGRSCSGAEVSISEYLILHNPPPAGSWVLGPITHPLRSPDDLAPPCCGETGCRSSSPEISFPAEIFHPGPIQTLTSVSSLSFSPYSSERKNVLVRPRCKEVTTMVSVPSWSCRGIIL